MALGGCADQPVATSTTKTPLSRQANAAASPVVAGGENGLELRWWVSSAEPALLGAVLAPYVDRPLSIDARQRAMLEANGLRLIAVPVDQLPTIQSRLGIIGAEQRQWLGQAPAWVEAVPGPSRENGQTVAMSDGPLRLGPGKLRLLVRSWTVPKAPTSPGGPAAALHIEVIPQHQESNPPERSGAGLALTPVSREADEQGLLFTRLHTRLTGNSGEAFLLVPEVPGAKWRPLAEGESLPPPPVVRGAQPAAAPRQPTGVGQVIRDPGGGGGGGGGAPAVQPGPQPPPTGPGVAFADPGPPSDVNPTVGEAMLLSTVTEPNPRTVRAVVLLVPHVPARYDLLPK